MKVQYFVTAGKKTTSFNDLAEAHTFAEKAVKKTSVAEITSRYDRKPEQPVCTVFSGRRTEWYH